MIKRALSGFVLVALTLSAIYFGDLWFSIFFVVVSLLAIDEWGRAFSFSKRERAWTSNLVFLMYGGANLIYRGWLDNGLWVLIPAIGFLILVFFLFYESITLEKLAQHVLGITYVLIPMLAAHELAFSGEYGIYQSIYLFAALAAIWANDTFAYLTGRLIGRTPLFISVSPNKTIEGTAAGLLFATGSGLAFAWFGNEQWFFWAGFGLIGGIGAVIGDLIESKIKRSLGMKDMGNIMPGHGGVLDRFDAFFFAMPLLAAYVVVAQFLAA